MSTELYKIIDKIVEVWDKIEVKLAGAEFEVEHCDLSMKRIGDRVRLCYKGRPIRECKALEKIDAADQLDCFCMELEKRDLSLIERAKETLSKLEDWITNYGS